jgi:hypothetical protein
LRDFGTAESSDNKNRMKSAETEKKIPEKICEIGAAPKSAAQNFKTKVEFEQKISLQQSRKMVSFCTLRLGHRLRHVETDIFVPRPPSTFPRSKK